MQVLVIGLGYVGSVVAAGLAAAGHDVTGIDTDFEKISSFSSDCAGIKEPDLASMAAETIKAQKLSIRHISQIERISQSIVIICVGTPVKPDGSVDLSQIMTAISWIKQKSAFPVTIVMKSTVPPGTGESIVASQLKDKNFQYVMNPEFLQEGQAVHNWFHPDRTVLGSDQDSAIEQVSELYKNIDSPMVITDINTAEMIKYAANAFLATKISFINEIAKICEAFGADIDTVSRGVGLDKRIGPSFLKAGLGYGGSCFPKDTRALNSISSGIGLNFELLQAVIDVNNKQRLLAIIKLKSIMGTLKNKRIAVLGLAFKPNTDDIREAPSLEIINLLINKGAEVQVFDPVAMPNAKRQLPPEVKYFNSSLEALEGAQGVILATEWKDFIDLDWSSVKNIMQEPFAIVDGRNCLDGVLLKAYGFKYTAIGR
jgi:UDPglucose 6-dehydrogenase